MSAIAREALAERLRELTPALATQVTQQFLDQHPDWRRRYGTLAMSAGVQDAQYHLSFLAAAVENGDHTAFSSYVRWAARVLAARDIAPRFLAEHLERLRDAVRPHVAPSQQASLHEYFTIALTRLADEPDAPAAFALPLAAEMFLQAILSGQRAAALQVAREALANGLTIPQVYVEMFQPALYEVGARWEANRLSVAEEHMATAITQYVMAQIYQPPPHPGRPRGSIVLTGVEGELHNIGLVMVGDIFESSGWQVRFLGTHLPAVSILSAIRETKPTHVGISATILFNVGTVRQLIQRIRDEYGDRLTILVGGAAFRTTPDLWREVSADAFASDLRDVEVLASAPA